MADVTWAMGRRRAAACRGKSGEATAAGALHRRIVPALAAIALTLLVGGCVCRPLHVSENPPDSVEALKASLP